jgi:hypothetical protein
MTTSQQINPTTAIVQAVQTSHNHTSLGMITSSLLEVVYRFTAPLGITPSTPIRVVVGDGLPVEINRDARTVIFGEYSREL